MTAPSLHHVGYVVRDMQRALRQFGDEGAELLLGPTDDPIQRVTCALVRLADGIDLELVAPLDPEDSPVSARLRRGGGLDHICLAVDDVAAALSDEVDRDALVVCEPVHAVTFRRTVAFVRRRSGLVVELMSRQPEAADS
jgi:methylmalonyl-CoA/ethylmalonyl-CoA epimerase